MYRMDLWICKRLTNWEQSRALLLRCMQHDTPPLHIELNSQTGCVPASLMWDTFHFSEGNWVTSFQGRVLQTKQDERDSTVMFVWQCLCMCASLLRKLLWNCSFLNYRLIVIWKIHYSQVCNALLNYKMQCSGVLYTWQCKLYWCCIYAWPMDTSC